MTTLVFDGHHLLHRTAFIPDLQRLSSSYTDVPTGPVFGFLRVLRANLNTFKADSCIVVWDSPGGSQHRRDIYPAYKANRAEKEKPEALKYIGEQIEILQSILPYLNVKQLAIPGYEGDDLMELVSETLKEVEPHDELDVVVVTGDKDLLQLVGGPVTVYRPIASEQVDDENFEHITGVPNRALFLLRKAVIGDKSDNIDGVRGVGEKTADKLLKEAYYTEDEEWASQLDYDVFRQVCESHKTKTAKRISDEWDVVKRNLRLIDLKNICFTDAQKRKAKAVVESEPGSLTTDIELMQMLGRYEFNEFTSRFAQWIQPFRAIS